MRAALIVNPRARTLAAIDDAADRLRQAAIDAGITLVGKAPPDAPLPDAPLPDAPLPDAPLDEAIEAALAAKPDAVLVAGGDGTLRAVAAHMVDTGIALGIIPGGTMNRLAGRLGLPTDPFAAIAALATATPRKIAVGAVGNEIFLYQSLVGRQSRLVQHRESARDLGSRAWARLLLAALRAARRPMRRRLFLVSPGGEQSRAGALVLTLPEPDAAVQAIRADALQPAGVARRLAQVWAWARGRLHDRDDVLTRQAESFVVHSTRERIRMTLDGEMLLLPGPLAFRVRPAALCVLVPAGVQPEALPAPHAVTGALPLPEAQVLPDKAA